MAKRLFARGSDGKVAIFKGTDPAPFNSPLSNLADLYFHSDLGYLGNGLLVTGTISHGERTRSSSTSKGLFGSSTHYNPRNGTADYLLATHDYAAGAPFVAFVGDAQMPSGTAVQKVGESVRAVSVYVTSTQIRVFENWATFDNTLGAVNRTYSVILFDRLTTATDTTSILIEPNRFRAGFGKLDTDFLYLRKQDTNPDFYVTAGKTADVNSGRLKVVLPDGSIPINDSGYGGGFTGSTGTGVDL
jgi:hypothetical protein